METEKLQKVIAAHGICSRRKAEELIGLGKVRVNGKTATIGMRVTVSEKIEVNGQYLERGGDLEDKLVYIALNKPVDYITSTTSRQGDSVMELLVPENYAGKNKEMLGQRVFPVGRLDKESEGLVILTNDGELTNLLTHPSNEHEKEYDVTILERLSKDAIDILGKGMDIGEGEVARGIEVRNISNRGKRTIVTVVLKEGKKRQIRRMFGRLGYSIIALKRTRISKYRLKALAPGQWTFIEKKDILK